MKNPEVPIANSQDINADSQIIKEEASTQQRDAIREAGSDQEASEANVASGSVSLDETSKVESKVGQPSAKKSFESEIKSSKDRKSKLNANEE